jgi:hypothetical protein
MVSPCGIDVGNAVDVGDSAVIVGRSKVVGVSWGIALGVGLGPQLFKERNNRENTRNNLLMRLFIKFSKINGLTALR